MTEMLPELDQRVASALQVDGRAGPGRIAAALRVSARTVTRSLSRIASAVRVVRVPDPRHGLPATTMLRIRVLRGRVEVIADALARRPEVLFVDVLAGGEEISTVVVGGRPELPTGQAVTSVRAYSVMHVFSDAADWRTGLLTPEETAALTPPAPTLRLEPDELDTRMLAVLGTDARIGSADLAAAVHAPESTVRRRLERLSVAGLLRTCVVADPRVFGLTVDANVWLTVPPGRLDDLGRRLATSPLVHGVLATTGETNLMAAVFCRDLPALYEFVTGLHDVPAAEVTVVGGAVMRVGHRPG